MRQFFVSYYGSLIWQPATAKLSSAAINQWGVFCDLSFTLHLILIIKCPNLEERQFYKLEATRQFWSITILEHQITNGSFEVQGKLPNNFKSTLPVRLQTTALQIFKDEYLIDFMDLN